MKKLLHVFYTFTIISILASCDSEYDLTKEIGGDITVGGNELAFPIGTTEKILVDKLLNIEDDKTLIVSENGDYYITMKDNVKPTTFSVPNVMIGGTRIDTKPLKFSAANRSRSISLSRALVNFKTSEPFIFELESSLPSEIISVTSTTFKKDDQGSYPHLTLDINFSGFPKEVSSINLSNIILDLPETLIYEPDSEIVGKQLIASGDVALNGGSGKYIKTVYISGGDFTSTNIITDADGNKTLQIEQSLNMQGDISINSIDPIDPDITAIKGEPSIEFTGASIATCKGEVDVNINPVEFLYITEFPSFMNDPGTYLDLLNSSLSIDATTNSTAAINAKTTIKSQKNNTYIDNSQIDLDLTINPSTVGGGMVTTQYWISNSNEKAPASHTWINKNISTLIADVPEMISISVVPQIAKTTSIIELGKEYQVKIGYNLLIPLMLGEKLTINYTESFDNLQDDISDYTDIISELILDVETTNNVPLDLTITPSPLDSNGNVISGLEISVDGDIKSAEKDNSNKITGTKDVKSNSKLIIKETTKGALKELDAIKLNIKAKSSKLTEGTMLNKNQYLIMSVKAKIPGGITININE